MAWSNSVSLNSLLTHHVSSTGLDAGTHQSKA
jgi:hypothetical protein